MSECVSLIKYVHCILDWNCSGKISLIRLNIRGQWKWNDTRLYKVIIKLVLPLQGTSNCLSYMLHRSDQFRKLKVLCKVMPPLFNCSAADFRLISSEIWFVDLTEACEYGVDKRTLCIHDPHNIIVSLIPWRRRHGRTILDKVSSRYFTALKGRSINFNYERSVWHIYINICICKAHTSAASIAIIYGSHV